MSDEMTTKIEAAYEIIFDDYSTFRETDETEVNEVIALVCKADNEWKIYGYR